METSNLFEKTIFLHRLVTGQRMGLSSLRYFIVSGNKNYHSILSDAALLQERSRRFLRSARMSVLWNMRFHRSRPQQERKRISPLSAVLVMPGREDQVLSLKAGLESKVVIVEPDFRRFAQNLVL